MLRFAILLLAPSAAIAGGGGVIDLGPLFGGPRAIAGVGVQDYPRGQEVLLEIHATSDRPGAEKVFLGQAKAIVGGAGAKFVGPVQIVTLISDPLPDTNVEWKIQYWVSPNAKSPGGNTPVEWTARRKPAPRK